MRTVCNLPNSPWTMVHVLHPAHVLLQGVHLVLLQGGLLAPGVVNEQAAPTERMPTSTVCALYEGHCVGRIGLFEATCHDGQG